ncbi:hypothetical protein HDF08_000071 [Edaphobacter lichenicola]|uniref:Uncharacterized protein n=1 Tax=Tunturiibacter lichenicola TaxID=2051959 RepID=A0A852VC13_9BACT|nr:hypothetical protein [Edaphobacter lichenicola]
MLDRIDTYPDTLRAHSGPLMHFIVSGHLRDQLDSSYLSTVAYSVIVILLLIGTLWTVIVVFSCLRF